MKNKSLLLLAQKYFSKSIVGWAIGILLQKSKNEETHYVFNAGARCYATVNGHTECEALPSQVL